MGGRYALRYIHGVYAEMRDLPGRKSVERLPEVVRPLPFDMAAAHFPSNPFRRGRSDRFIVSNDESGFGDIPGLKAGNWTLTS